MIKRNILVFLLVLLGSGAIFGGGALTISPGGTLLGMPVLLLEHSPFNDFLIPGIVLFMLLGVVPIGVAIAMIRRPVFKLAERLNLCSDMYWAWTYCIYIVFTLIIWIQAEMVFLRAVHWAHTLYVIVALLILFMALSPKMRFRYKK